MSTQSLHSENSMKPESLALTIDHTKLTFGPNEDELAAIQTLCEEARQYGFFSVCVRPRHIALAKKLLAGSNVKVATVIGFPVEKVDLASEQSKPTVGNIPLSEKVAETHASVQAGANELDLVIDVAVLKQAVAESSDQTLKELIAIREAAQGQPIKVIIETDLLDDTEITQVSRWCAQTGMGMVKTSTGMVSGGKGATLEAVRLIAQTLREEKASTQIKASGGIKNREQALALLEVGAARLGTSSGAAIVQGNRPSLSSEY